MKRFVAWLSPLWRAEKGRPVALILLAFFSVLLCFPDLPPFKSARLALFDEYQSLSPRKSQTQPVVVVTIDEDTLKVLGQWPWPRNYLAALIDAIAALKPSALGLDIIMPEADRASPQAIAESRTDLPENVRKILLDSASNDSLLATSLSSTPSILGAAGFKFPTSSTLDGLRTKTIKVEGEDPLPLLNAYPYVLGSLPEFQAAARGQALLSSDSELGIVRRAAMLSAINGTIVPGLPLEMLRIAHNTPDIVVESGAHGVVAVNIGAQYIPLQSNGEAWIHFDEPSSTRYISALNLLRNEVSPERINGKMVLIGLTGLGLVDMITTPLGDSRPGVEVHAQLIESFEDGHFLTRPWWLHWLEIGVLVVGGLFLIWTIPNTKIHPNSSIDNAARRAVQPIVAPGGSEPYAMQERRSQNRAAVIKPRFAAILALLLLVLLFGAGIALFRWEALLFDAASLFIALGTVFASLLSSAFIEADRERESTIRTLQNQRLKAAQLAGELDAARRIQLGMLPDASTAFMGEKRFEIDAMLEPARQVGGDLYDFFMIDDHRLFFVIGDVSGKGLPASLFMVVTKALAKSAALRDQIGLGKAIEKVIALTNMEMARENPEMLFVTALAGILDVTSGALELVNAGHGAPLRIGSNGQFESIKGDGGPPLCVLDNFNYPVEHLQLAVGDTLLLLTDGITEAMNANKELYGMGRVNTVLQHAEKNQPPHALVAALREDVRSFVGNTEASDDLTLLVLRWLGPEGRD